MFKPTEIETPKSKSFGDYAPGTGQAGDGITAPPDRKDSLFTPTEVLVPQSTNVTDYAPGTGQAGDTVRIGRGFRLQSDRPQNAGR